MGLMSTISSVRIYKMCHFSSCQRNNCSRRIFFQLLCSDLGGLITFIQNRCTVYKSVHLKHNYTRNL